MRLVVRLLACPVGTMLLLDVLAVRLVVGAILLPDALAIGRTPGGFGCPLRLPGLAHVGGAAALSGGH